MHAVGVQGSLERVEGNAGSESGRPHDTSSLLLPSLPSQPSPTLETQVCCQLSPAHLKGACLGNIKRDSKIAGERTSKQEVRPGLDDNLDALPQRRPLESKPATWTM